MKLTTHGDNVSVTLDIPHNIRKTYNYLYEEEMNQYRMAVDFWRDLRF